MRQHRHKYIRHTKAQSHDQWSISLGFFNTKKHVRNENRHKLT